MCEIDHAGGLGRQDGGGIAPQRTRMQPLCGGHLRVGWADRILQTDFLRPDTMPIRPEQMLFLLMKEMVLGLGFKL